MSLTQAVNTAQAIFNNTGTQTAILSKNISNAYNSNYARRSAVLSTSLFGADVIATQRAQNDALLRQVLRTTAGDSAQQTLLDGLTRIQATIGGNESELSPQAALKKFQSALNTYAGAPANTTTGAAAVSAASEVVNTIRNATQEIQTIRSQADQALLQSAGELRDLLGQFQKANDAVIVSSAAGTDASDAMDVREGLLKKISEIVGVTGTMRENNDMVLYTSEGITLFETTPREIKFVPTASYAPGVQGNSFYIDGVAVQPGTGGNTNGMGKIAALLQIRDTVAPTYQKQLDEIARGLVTQFAETSNAAPITTLPGLFTWSGGTVPPAGTIVNGISSTLQINPAVLSNPNLLRDGAINGAAYNKNPSSNAGFSLVLNTLYNGLDTPLTFDVAAEAGVDSGLLGYAAKSVGWFSALRSDASNAGETKNAMVIRATESYSSETGVSIDQELSDMLDIEQSYKASTKLLSAVDEMLKALMEIAG